ncbi:mechanosensitive ion channel family protein [Bordetella sp. 15P40C-2]|uniref:mechanosensitive ion channel family protein n=1 Tax=Bordetella sp. 15P40C-2 TaxID=2572246 RepID=UPI0013244DF3|nr:mechanosensitive ion channel family protein [Bordetella sp. 15P40C-2]MVW72597.1 mechanosensitive ion channel [Bordetella sp. 15P40C-2]
MRWYRALAVGCCAAWMIVAMNAPTYAMAERALSPVNTSSPSETYQSLVAGIDRLEELYTDYKADKSFEKLREIRYQFGRLRALLDLADVPSANRVKVGNAAMTYLADILVRLPPVDVKDIPGGSPSDKALPARWTIPGTDIQIAKMEGGPQSDEYLITAQSIADLADYYHRVEDLPVLQPRRYNSLHKEHINATGPLIPNWLTSHVPDALKVVYLSTPLWKIIAIAIVAFAMLVVAVLWARLTRIQRRRGSEVRRLGWQFTLPTMLLLLYSIGDWFVISHLNPAGYFATGERLLSTAAFYVVVAWAVWIACYLIAETIINSPRIAGNSLDAHLLRLTARVAAIGSVGAILIYGANEIGIPALGLIAGIGVGGFALALAAQSTIENLFGGVALFVDRPFRIGDVISFGDQRGAVEMVGTRSSRIRAMDGTLVTVPNSDLARMKIVNYSRRNKCLFIHTLALQVDTPPARLRQLLERLRELLAAEPMVEKKDGWPRVRWTGVAVGHLEVEIRAYVQTDNYTKFLDVQESLLLSIFELIEALQIKLVQPRIVSTAGTERIQRQSSESHIDSYTEHTSVSAD